MDNVCMLSTLDNPFNPFDDFTSWYMYDCEKGHNTASRIARIADLNSEMTQKEQDEAMRQAIEFIMKHDLEKKFTVIYNTDQEMGNDVTLSE